ncbi:MAG: anti-sigma factor family protein [Terriglobales bacterium]
MITLTCDDFLTRVSDFIDGELDGAWREAVSAHAHACGHCAVILDTTQRTVQLAGEPELFPLPAEVAERLHARVAAALAAAPAATENGPGATAEWARPPAPPAAVAPRRGLLAGWNWPMAWAVFGAVLIIFGGLSWWQQVRVRTLQGWLIDAHCAARYVAAGALPTDHPRWCLLRSACMASGYGVMTARGRFWPFNRTGNMDALDLLRATTRAKNLRVTVRGQERGRLLYVRGLRWTQPKGLISVHLRAPVAFSPVVRAAAYLAAPAP